MSLAQVPVKSKAGETLVSVDEEPSRVGKWMKYCIRVYTQFINTVSVFILNSSILYSSSSRTRSPPGWANG